MAITECAAPIIETKDRLHRRWFNLQSPQSNLRVEGMAYLNKPLLDQIIQEANNAIDYAEQCQGDQRQIANVRGILDRLKDKLQEASKTRYLGQNYYVLFPDEATTILISDINKLINGVHKLGSSFVEISGTYAGCMIEEGGETRELNRAALAYCEGVGTKATLRKNGTSVEHPLGAHSNVAEFEEQEDGYEAKLHYTESGAYNWRARQKGVVGYLNSIGLDCQTADLSAECKGKVKDPRKITELAYFLSSIRDVDLLPSDCLDAAIDWAKEEAKNTVTELDGEAYKRKPYPNSEGEWNETVCYTDGDKSREDARRRRIELYNQDVDYWKGDAEFRRKKIAKSPCIRDTYDLASKLLAIENYISHLCEDIASLGGDTAKCEFAKDYTEGEDAKSFAELVRRCPPESIIRKAEASHTGWELERELWPIREVCATLDNAECLKELDSAIERDRKGIKQIKLLE